MQVNKRKIIIGAAAMILIAESYYFVTSYKQDREQINSNRKQIEAVQVRREQLEERVKIQQENEKELKRLELQKAGIEDKIPSEGSRAKMESDLLESMSLIDCLDSYISSSSTEILSSSIGNIHQLHYQIEFISTYQNSRNFLEDLIKSYQLCTIQSYHFDASIQNDIGAKGQKYRSYFKEQYNSIGRTSIQFDLYYRSTEVIEDEIYQAGLTGKVNPSPFKNTGSLVVYKESLEKEEKSKEQEIDNVNAQKSDFLLNIGDALTLGDTYKLSGPGNTTENYIGLTTTAPILTKLTMNTQGYKLYMEDSEGHKKETYVQYSLNTPMLRIISNRKPLPDRMAKIDVYIDNQIDKPVKVFLIGAVDNIHVYNEKEQEVLKGETKGKVSLI